MSTVIFYFMIMIVIFSTARDGEQYYAPSCRPHIWKTIRTSVQNTMADPHYQRHPPWKTRHL